MTDSVKNDSGVENTEAAEPVPEAEVVAPTPEEAKPAEPKPAEPTPEEPGIQEPEEKKPVPEYDIVPSKRLEPEGSIAPDHYRPVVTAAGVEAQTGQGKGAPGKAADPKTSLSDAALEKLGKLGSSQTRVYAAVGVGLGLLVGLVAAVFFLHPGGTGGASDMGTVNANDYGLKWNSDSGVEGQA